MNYFAVEGSLYQWDTGRRVTLTLPYDEYASVVEFSVNNEAEALVVSVVDNVAEIPNKLLQRSGSLRLWAVTIEENGRQTRRYGNLPIFPRAKPDDYVYTETEIMDYRKVAEDLAELVQRVEEIEENGVQGGGAVASVNGKTGEVYLNAADVGALPTTGGKLTGNLTAPRLISTAADAAGNIYEVQLYPTANGDLYMPLRHNGAVTNAMSMSQSATTFGKPVAVSSGGHGGKNAAEGRKNLDLYSKEEVDAKIPKPYTLPTASADTLGGVKVGEGLQMDGDVLNVQDKVYTHIETFTFGEDMAFERTQEPSGRAYAFDAIALQINKPAGVTIDKAISIGAIFTGGRIVQPLYFVPCAKADNLWMLATVENYKGLARRTRTTDWAIYNSTSAVNEVPFLMFDNVLRKGDAIVSISTSQIIPAGITFEIWGVRANA